MRNERIYLNKSKIDWVVTFVPLILIVGLCILFFAFPNESKIILEQVRYLLGDRFGVYYLVIGLGIFIFSLYVAFSRYGDIVLGKKGEKPAFSLFTWGAMMFTSGMAADIIFWGFSEWVLYAADPHIKELGSIQDWASVFPIFHWSFVPWGFYLGLAVPFGFMLHVRKRKRQKFSEACRPILGKHTDGILGRLIDLLAVFGLLGGTATTFSVATPLMASIIEELFHFKIDLTLVSIVILLITCFVYTVSLLHKFKGITFLANSCIYLVGGLLVYVLLFSGKTSYIIETGFSAMGSIIQNFFHLATFTDPLRQTSFPQNWTIFYWGYCMVWSVAAPFFMGSISKGRTIRQTILGGYLCGLGYTVSSFSILGNYSLEMQVTGKFDFVNLYLNEGSLYSGIITMIKSLPLSSIILVLVLLTMIALYATSFDSIALIASCYSYKELEENEQPHKLIQLMWCILLILLPVALVFSESSMSNLQSVSIISAFPIGIVILLIIFSFLKDAKCYLKETGYNK